MKFDVGKYHVMVFRSDDMPSKNGRPKKYVPVDKVLKDRSKGMSERALARKYQVSKTKIHNVVKLYQQ